MPSPQETAGKDILMNNTLKKLLVLTLAVLMALSTLAACANNEDDPEDTLGEKATEAEGTKNVYDALEKTKYTGETFTVLCRTDLMEDFYIEQYGAQENDILDDMIYERNSVIKNDFGVTIDTFDGGDYNAINDKIKTQQSGGLDEFDIAIGHKYTFNSCAQNNYLLDMNEIGTMNLQNPWWDGACRDNLTVSGKTVLMVGDIFPSSMQISSCFVFNKKLLKELGKDEPYDAVREQKWTLDMFNELTADVTLDLNGDGKIEYTADRYGMTSWMMDVPFSMYYGAGGMFCRIDEDGLPVLDFDQEEMFNIYAKIYQGLITQQAYFVTDGALYPTTYEPFIAGRALFCDITLGKLSFLQEMDQDYGIVPVPKYDEYQPEYLSFVNGASGLIGIINTETRADFVGTILEAMGAYNYANVSPNMFEICTKLKAARDPQSSEMVDLIIRNRIYDFAYWFDLPISNVVLQQLQAKKAEISSAVKSSTKSSTNSLKQILRAYEKSAAAQ